MVADSLMGQHVIAVNEAALVKDRAAELETRYRIEQRRLALMTQTIGSQLAVQQSQLDRLRAIVAFQRNVVRSLQVRAGDSGVVSDLTLQLGQWVLAGTVLAKVVQPGKLKAALQIPETQAKDLAVGQHASIDTRNAMIPGRVVRIDPNAINGTVAIDIALDGPLPGGRATRPLRRRDDRDRAPSKRPLHRSSRIRATKPAFGMFKISEAGHLRDAGAGACWTDLGEPDRDPRWTERG